MEQIITIVYDDQPDGVVWKISSALAQFGLTIEEVGGDDGYMEYKIEKLK